MGSFKCSLKFKFPTSYSNYLKYIIFKKTAFNPGHKIFEISHFKVLSLA